MKHFFIAGLLALLVTGYSCKGKDKTTPETTSPTTNTTPNTAPVEISADDELRKGVTDATKDFPGVNADVKDGVITVTGEVDKDRATTLLQSLHALKPKQLVNNLKYK